MAGLLALPDDVLQQVFRHLVLEYALSAEYVQRNAKSPCTGLALTNQRLRTVYRTFLETYRLSPAELTTGRETPCTVCGRPYPKLLLHVAKSLAIASSTALSLPQLCEHIYNSVGDALQSACPQLRQLTVHASNISVAHLITRWPQLQRLFAFVPHTNVIESCARLTELRVLHLTPLDGRHRRRLFPLLRFKFAHLREIFLEVDDGVNGDTADVLMQIRPTASLKCLENIQEEGGMNDQIEEPPASFSLVARIAASLLAAPFTRTLRADDTQSDLQLHASQRSECLLRMSGTCDGCMSYHKESALQETVFQPAVCTVFVETYSQAHCMQQAMRLPLPPAHAAILYTPRLAMQLTEDEDVLNMQQRGGQPEESVSGSSAIVAASLPILLPSSDETGYCTLVNPAKLSRVQLLELGAYGVLSSDHVLTDDLKTKMQPVIQNVLPSVRIARVPDKQSLPPNVIEYLLCHATELGIFDVPMSFVIEVADQCAWVQILGCMPPLQVLQLRQPDLSDRRSAEAVTVMLNCLHGTCPRLKTVLVHLDTTCGARRNEYAPTDPSARSTWIKAVDKLCVARPNIDVSRLRQLFARAAS